MNWIWIALCPRPQKRIRTRPVSSVGQGAEVVQPGGQRRRLLRHLRRFHRRHHHEYTLLNLKWKKVRLRRQAD